MLRTLVKFLLWGSKFNKLWTFSSETKKECYLNIFFHQLAFTIQKVDSDMAWLYLLMRATKWYFIFFHSVFCLWRNMVFLARLIASTFFFGKKLSLNYWLTQEIIFHIFWLPMWRFKFHLSIIWYLWDFFVICDLVFMNYLFVI